MNQPSKLTTSHCEVITSRNKLTNAVIGTVTTSTPEDVTHASEKALRAQESWNNLGAKGRLPFFKNLIKVIFDQQDEIVELINQENGKNRIEAYSIIMPILQSIKLYSKLAIKLEKGKKVSSTFFVGANSHIFYQPKGIVGYIIPWNFPFELGLKHLIPALASGNAVIEKPSDQTPFIGNLIGKLFQEAGFPNDLIQIIHGYGDTAQALVNISDAVVFIGSTKVGRLVSEQAGKRMIPAILELGGKDAAIVLADADINLTAKGLVQGACYTSGQTCVAIERIYVHTDIHQKLIYKIRDELQHIRLAIDSPDLYEIGPVISPAQVKIYQTHLQDALDKGAILIHGGEIIEKNSVYFCQPTLLTNCHHQMLIMQEETFGPFICIQEVKSNDEMIQLANDSQYGLSGSIWTKNVELGINLALKMDTGGVMINNSVQIGGCLTLPFGGRKESGIGFLQGEDAYFNFVNQKSVMSKTENISKDSWMPYKAKSLSVTKNLIGASFSPYGIFSRISYSLKLVGQLIFK